MKIVTAQEMREIDRKAIEGWGIPGVILMENAGLSVLSCIEEYFGDLRGLRVTIVAGKGNNGGDGCVVARHIKNSGGEPLIVLLAERKNIKGDARINLKTAIKGGIDVIEVSGKERFSLKVKRIIEDSDIIVDAIFGTGLSEGVKGFYGDVIEYINGLEIPVVSIDLPSGISSDTGEIIGPSIAADLTVALCLPKISLVSYPAARFAGVVEIGDIGIPVKIIDESRIKTFLIEEEEIAGLLKPRRENAHKGDFGHVLVIAGSTGKTGAATMTSEAALKSGAGLATLAIPESLNPIVEMKLTEVMSLPVPETSEKTFSKKAEKIMLEFSRGKTVAVIGPGISTNTETCEVVRSLIKKLDVPVVLDADGINALQGDAKILKSAKKDVVITPHPGEMGRLCGLSAKEVQKNRIEVARDFARANRVYVVLKGKNTVVSGPDGTVFVNLTGNPGMASGGAGDVLTGMIAGFISQGFSPIDAAKAGVYLHGLSGDIMAEKRGEMSLTAMDILKGIPAAIREILSQKSMKIVSQG
ncbi:MAG: hypothetical protein A3H37_02035 [Candidatus Schekmanbacteria bacterium RIFCSPLOWO2_02_FULL_38_14]|nr:MAG: hypothetical protein A3H37_02035 [Candidatus Schekmanbacteria bacterium RIFCSPLOWO2_02_FULL_38_14]